MQTQKPTIIKRFFSAGLILLLLITTLLSIFPTATVFAASQAVTTDALNLREGPGTQYKSLTVLAKGTTLTVVDTQTAGWIKVKTSDGKEGYCSSDYLNISTVTSSSETAVAKEGVRLRTGPGTNYDTITVIYSGSVVSVLDKSNSEWTKVKTSDGKEGYCSSQYLTFSSGTSSSGSGTSAGTSSGSDSQPIRTLTLDTRSYVMAPGNIYDFRAAVSGPGLSQEDVVVTTSRDAIATVARVPGTNKYRITGVKPGECYIIAEINGVHASIKVTVQNGVKAYGDSERSVSIVGYDTGSSSSGQTDQTGSITLDTKSYNFSQTGMTYTVLAKGIASGAASSAISTNTSVVTVSLKSSSDPRGHLYELTAVGPGTAIVTITSGSSGASMTVTVAGGSSTSTPSDSSSSQGSSSSSGSWSDDIFSDNFGDYGGSSSGSSGNSGSSSSSDTARTTTSVNLRSGPGTSYTVLEVLNSGVTLTVLSTSNSAWTYVRAPSGNSGYVSSDYIQFGASGGTSTGVTLSHTSGSIPQGKTYFIKATSSGTVTWSSNNTSVATVNGGFIYAASPGTAVITAQSGSYSATCTVTVTEAEPVKAAYTSPNIAGVGATVNLVAVTDDTRTGVRFVVNRNGSTQSIDVTNYTSEVSSHEGLANNSTRVWKATTSFSSPGTYTVTVYSYKNGQLSSTGISTSSFVVSSQDFEVSSTEQRRVSDQMLNLMCQWEGYSAAVYQDQLTYTPIPTIGYGQTYSAGAKFYNNITKTEAWALLLNTVNNSYTSEVNKFITSNGLKVNQQEFDAMISFSHNVGAGYWNGTSPFDVKQILLNAVVPPEITPGSSMSARTTANATLYYDSSFSSGTVTELMSGTSVQVRAVIWDESTKSGWYQVLAPDGTSGWARSGFIRFDSTSLVHDLNYTDAWAFGSEWLAWHHAGGKCIAGLIYRRLGEAKVFSFGNYAEASSSSSLYRHNTYGYTYPSCAKQYEQ